MKNDLIPFFKKYEALVANVETVFAQVRDKYPEEVKCKQGCADCCHALFDLTLIEALYVNSRFNEKIAEKEKHELLEKANKADRLIYKIKKEAYRAHKDGENEDTVIEEVAKKRIRCPLLGENDLCDMYEYRPIACRVYGIPQAIGGQGRTCGFSGFKAGESYPTLNLDIVHDQLMALSSALVQEIRSRHFRMAEVLVPLSMALITDYNDEYMGIAGETALKDEPRQKDKNEKMDTQETIGGKDD